MTCRQARDIGNKHYAKYRLAYNAQVANEWDCCFCQFEIAEPETSAQRARIPWETSTQKGERFGAPVEREKLECDSVAEDTINRNVKAFLRVVEVAYCENLGRFG